MTRTHRLDDVFNAGLIAAVLAAMLTVTAPSIASPSAAATVAVVPAPATTAAMAA